MTEPDGGRPAHGVSLRTATSLWAQVGLNSFGGPAGQISVMHREIVERRRWLSEGRFLHALNYCMILPGPEAQQLATYIGWLMNGVTGGAIAGTLFVLPGFVAMLALSISYAVLGGVTWVAGLLFGIQAAVVAIVAEAVLRIGRRALRSNALRAIAAASFVAIFVLGVPFPFIILGAAAVGWAVGRVRPGWLTVAGHADAAVDDRPALLSDDEDVDRPTRVQALRAAAVCLLIWLVPVAILVVVLGSKDVYVQESLLFSKSALVTFGGAYAVLGYIAQQAVQHYGWISAKQMIVGLGLAETTPGPLIMVVEFVGFLAAYHHPGSLPPLLAGTLGAVVTVWVTFVPCFLFIFLGAPYVERLRGNASLSRALSAVSASVAGVVLNLAVWFAIHTAFAHVDDRRHGASHVPVPEWSSVRVASLALSVLAAILVFRFKVATLKVLGAAAVCGAALALLRWT